MFASAQVLRLRVLLVAGLIAATPFMAVSQGSTFTTVDAPGAGTGAQQGTAITAIDTAGDVAGIYLDTNNVVHGFVLPAGGTIQTFNVSSAGTNAGQGTFPSSINSSGVIAGGYTDSINAAHGFVRAANGTITTFDAPGAPTTTANRGTVAMGINDSGVIVGFYSTGTYNTNSVYHGFQRLATSPYTITNIDAPNAGTGNGPGFKQGTEAYGINASGEIVGSYTDSNFYHHGFLLSGSTYTVIDPPGASTTQCINSHGKNFGGANADSIDTAGDIAGSYLDTSCAQHGFVRTASGTYTSLDAAGADTSPCSSSAGVGETLCGTGLLAVLIDSVGDITGGYADTNGILHGFVRPVGTGTITGFSDPNAGTTGTISGTMGTGISSSASGTTIAGAYADTNSVLHGFIYTLALTATTTTLTPVPTPNPSVFGEPVTLTASVSSIGGTPPNGETVTFKSGTTSLGTAQLSSGVASLTTTALPVGTDSITAVYGGDSDFAGSTSAAVSQTVGKASSTTALTSSLNPSSFGQSVTFTATVSGQFGGTATGSVTFSNGSTSLGIVSLSGGSAILTTSALPVGADSITAVYSGDSDFAGSTSAAVSQTVSKATSTTALTSSLNPSASGASVTLTAAVSGQFGGTATGSVTFSNGSTSLGTVSLTGGSAGLTTTTLPVGTDSITGVYSGDSNFTGSTSNTLSQVVVLPNPVPAIGSLSPAFTDAGGATFTLTVNGSGFVSGSKIYWGTTALTTTYVSSSQLTASVTAADIASVGTSSITVQTSTPGGGTSNSWQFQVDSASGTSTAPTFTSTSATVTAGSPASYSVTLPSGVTSATATCLNLPTGATCSYSSGTVTIATTSATPKGTYQITIVFTETVSGAATSWILLPILLLPLVFLRRKLAARGVWVTACIGLALLVGMAASSAGCGGGGSSSTPPPQTHQATSSGTVSLTVQ